MNEQLNPDLKNIDMQTSSEWTGLKGRIGGWYLASPLRRLSEVLFLGDIRSAFLNELSSIIRGDEIILDVGAGSGYYSLAVAERLTQGKVICLDLSEEMLNRLERSSIKKGLGERIQIIRGGAYSIKLNDHSVDLTISNGVFHELSSPESCLREMIRILKPGGWVIITDFKITGITRQIEAAHKKEAHGPLSVEELEALFTKEGLSNVKVYPVKNWVIGIGRK